MSHQSFKNGNIVRISVKNFLTFDNVTVLPKPYLNFIIGPNGTGKSTILCAICICLGGKPEVTGRSKNIESYVKHGKDHASLEVELYEENGSNVVIKREFGHNISRFHLQGKPVSKKEIDNVVARFSIQIDNLCTFLPQDRVANFARMNSVQLLEATEKAVGEPKLFQYHELLRTTGSKMQDLITQVSERTKEIETLQRQNANMKDIVENVQEKARIEEDIRHFENNKLYYSYERKRVRVTCATEGLKQMMLKIKQSSKALKPLHDRIEAAKESYARQKRALHTKHIKFDEVHQKCNHLSSQAEKVIEDAKKVEFDFRSRKEAAHQRRLDLENQKRQLDVLESQYQSLPLINEKEIQNKLKKLTQDISAASTRLNGLANDMEECMTRKSENRRKIASNQAEIEKNQDVLRQRMELLKQRNDNAYKAAKWLESNANKFSAPFYMPICTLINVKEQMFSNVVESSISFNDMIAFVFEDKDDINKFKSMMDRMKFRVNIVHSVPVNLAAYQPPVPLNALRTFGFEYYMSDLIEAPPAVLAYLYKNNNMYRIPVSRREDIDHSDLPDKISQFYKGTLKVQRSRSRFDNETITETSKVREGNLLKIAVNQELINQLEREISQRQQSNLAVDMKMEELKTTEKSIKQDLELWRNEKQSYISREQERNQLKSRIQTKREQIRRNESQRFDEEKEEKQMEMKVLSSLRASLSFMEDGVRMLNNSQSQEYHKIICEMKLWDQCKKHMKDAVEGRELELQELEKSKSSLERERNMLKQDANHELKELVESLGYKSYSEIPMELVQKYSSITEEVVDTELNDLRARRDCLHTADEAEIRDYNEREAAISRLQRELEKIKSKNTNRLKEVEEIRSLWLPCITELISNISMSFTSFMERLGCAGEVQLIHDDENDFSKYGIAIMVKFRGGNKLRMLTAQHQSGGERAVATALYMLALQNMTSVPFRCVDEINQGMDPVNERLMLLMLMETAAKEESSQYFFVSPKLLHDLEYSDRVNTVIVHNGDFKLPKGRCLVRDSIKFRKRTKSRS